MLPGAHAIWLCLALQDSSHSWFTKGENRREQHSSAFAQPHDMHSDATWPNYTSLKDIEGPESPCKLSASYKTSSCQMILTGVHSKSFHMTMDNQLLQITPQRSLQYITLRGEKGIAFKSVSREGKGI